MATKKPNSLWSGSPEDLQRIAAGETKSVADTFVPPANFDTTPVVTEEQRKTGEIKAASAKIRSTTNYPASGSGDGRQS